MRPRRVTLEPLRGDGIAIMLRNRARAAGLDAERITPHSLRDGHATEAALAGVPLDRIAAQTRLQRRSTVLERYIRPAQTLHHTTSRGLQNLGGGAYQYNFKTDKAWAGSCRTLGITVRYATAQTALFQFTKEPTPTHQLPVRRAHVPRAASRHCHADERKSSE